MTAGVKNHRHTAGQVVAVLTDKNRGQWRDHLHHTDQISGAPANDGERAMGKQHVHKSSQVS